MFLNKLMIFVISLYLLAAESLYASNQADIPAEENEETNIEVPIEAPSCSMKNIKELNCLNFYAQDTMSLFYDFGKVHNAMSTGYILYNVANYTNHLAVLGKVIALAITGVASGGTVPLAILGGAIAYKASQGVANLEHVRRCSQYCTAEFAKSEAIKFSAAAFEKPAQVAQNSSDSISNRIVHTAAKNIGMTAQQLSYGDFIIQYGNLIPWDPYGLRFVQKAGQDFVRDLQSGGEQQGIKCLTKCSVGRVLRTLESLQKKRHSYEYPCKLIEYLPIDPSEFGYEPSENNIKSSTYMSLIRLAQMMATAHTFINTQSPLKTSRLAHFLKETKQEGKEGEYCIKIMDEGHNAEVDKTRLRARIKLLSQIQDRLVYFSNNFSRKKTRLHERVLEEGFTTPEKLKEKLDKYSTKINNKDEEGKTIAHMFAERGELQAVKIILEQGADISIKDDQNRLPLHYAAMMSPPTAIKKKKSFLPSFSSKKSELLKEDPEDDFVEIAKLLIEQGSDVLARDSNGETPRDLATKSQKMHKLLNANQSLLEAMKLEFDSQKIEQYLKDGAHLNLKDSEGRSLLDIAAKGGHTKVADFLLQQGMDVNQVNEDYNGWTPIFFAVHEGEIKMVEFLFDKGADIFVSDSHDFFLVDIAGQRLKTEKDPALKIKIQKVVEYLRQSPLDTGKECRESLENYRIEKIRRPGHLKALNEIKKRHGEKINAFKNKYKVDLMYFYTLENENEMERDSRISNITNNPQKINEKMRKLKEEKETKYNEERKELEESQKSELDCSSASELLMKGDLDLQNGFSAQSRIDQNRETLQKKEDRDLQDQLSNILTEEIAKDIKIRNGYFKSASEKFTACVKKIKENKCPVKQVKKKKRWHNLWGLF